MSEEGYHLLGARKNRGSVSERWCMHVRLVLLCPDYCHYLPAYSELPAIHKTKCYYLLP